MPTNLPASSRSRCTTDQQTLVWTVWTGHRRPSRIPIPPSNTLPDNTLPRATTHFHDFAVTLRCGPICDVDVRILEISRLQRPKTYNQQDSDEAAKWTSDRLTEKVASPLDAATIFAGGFDTSPNAGVVGPSRQPKSKSSKMLTSTFWSTCAQRHGTPSLDMHHLYPT